MTPLLGVDVSSYQGYPDWAAAAGAGVSFALTKATEGLGYTNPYFAGNWPRMRDAGLARGAYHYARPSLNGPIDEADRFLNTVGPLEPGDLMALDLEDTDVGPRADLEEWTYDWLVAVGLGVGFKPLLYSGTWYLEPHGCLGSAELSDYGLWLSGYQANMPAVPPDWPVIAIWQFDSQARIPGISGLVDVNYFLGDRAQLELYGRPNDMPKPQPQPALTKAQQHVTIYSVIGDMTYPDGVNMDEQAPGQPAGITRRVFQRELCQAGKALEGA